MRSATPDRPAIAVLGMGRMGAAIAGRLLAEGFHVSVWNRTPARAAPLRDAGAHVAHSPAQAVRDADIVITMLADGEAVHEVMTGPHGAAQALGPGGVWIQMSTVGVAWNDRLEFVAAEHQLLFVDAPVSGSDRPARDGLLVLLASGDEAIEPMVRPVFDAIGRRTLWLGPAGSGSRLKLVLNGWLATLVEGVAEALEQAEALGLDPALFLEAIDNGPLASAYAVQKGRAMLARDFEPGFPLRHALKDVRLALEAVGDGDSDPVLVEAVAARLTQALELGHGGDDVAAVISAAA